MDGEAARSGHVGGLETYRDPRRMLARNPHERHGKAEQDGQRQRRLKEPDMPTDQVTDCHLLR